jgi:peptidoglycan/LPS O-acetylase OafA/YrhL
MNHVVTNIGERFANSRNNLNLIRLAAALLVLFSHSFPLTNSVEPIGHYIGCYGDGGSLAVSAFFVVSGLLVTRSVLERGAMAYVVSRFLRIFPALCVVVLFQIFIVGPVFTTLPLGQYFSSPVTWDYICNVFVFNIRFPLPGVFAGLPNQGVNGSLWTLPLEAACYLILPFLAMVGLLRQYFVLAVLAATASLFFFSVQFLGLSWVNQGPVILSSVTMYPFLKFALFFVIGGTFWIHRGAIPMNGGLAVCCLALLYAGSWSYLSQAVLYLTLPYLVVYAAVARPIAIAAMSRIGDISYGTYLYAFPIQQSIVQLTKGKIGPLTLFLIATPIVLLAARLSFVLVERPVLQFRRRQPATALMSRLETTPR